MAAPAAGAQIGSGDGVNRSGCAVIVSAVMALTIALLGWLYANQDLLPPNSLPWKPVALDAPPGWIAHWQLRRLAGDGARCRAALGTASELAVTPLQDRKIDDRCGFTDVVRADASPIGFAPHVTATCGLTAALYWYQRQLAPVALAQMHTRLIGISQLGTFSCRNVNSESDGNRSEHATANAIDVASFHFADGRTVSVLKDYGKPTPAGRFLDAAHEEACRLFSVVLGPRYNRLHATHFHLDMGRYGICR
jgi:hypothetical protein